MSRTVNEKVRRCRLMRHIGQHDQEGQCPHNRKEAKNVAKRQNFSVKPYRWSMDFVLFPSPS